MPWTAQQFKTKHNKKLTTAQAGRAAAQAEAMIRSGVPECQKDDDSWTRLIVADRDGAKYFERQPVGVKVEDAFAAWGSGRDFALVAMYLGKTAKEAVEITSLFSLGCGNGVGSFDL